MSAATTRIPAEQRRDEVIAAARAEFAAGGYAGTSTDSIARRVGVSQPYLFQLFGTKKELFLAAVRSCFGLTRSAFEESGRRARTDAAGPHAILMAMAEAYVELVKDSDMLRLQLQAYAACGDPEIRAVVRDEFAALYDAVARASGADEKALEEWFARGMLINVAASIGEVESIMTPFVASLGRRR